MRRFVLGVLMTLVGGMISACSDRTNLEDLSRGPVASISGSQVIVHWSDEQLLDLFEDNLTERWHKDYLYKPAGELSSQGYTLHQAVLEETGGGVLATIEQLTAQQIGAQYYATLQGKDSTGNCLLIAVPLLLGEADTLTQRVGEMTAQQSRDDDDGGGLLCPDYTHSCAGSPCSSCSFEKNWRGCITGCDCNGFGGRCNHIVSTN